MKRFTTRTRARYCETDAAGVIYYGSFFLYFEVGKIEMYRELSLTYDRTIPIVETQCRYPAPCFYDDLLEIHTWVDHVGRTSFKICSEVYRVEDDESLAMVGEGHTVHVHIDEGGTAAPLPPAYRGALATAWDDDA